MSRKYRVFDLVFGIHLGLRQPKTLFNTNLFLAKISICVCEDRDYCQNETKRPMFTRRLIFFFILNSMLVVGKTFS